MTTLLGLLLARAGVAVTVLGFVSTSPRALRSAERLAPLIEGPREPEPAGVH